MRTLRYSKNQEGAWTIERLNWKRFRWENWITTRRGIINTINNRYKGNYLIYKKHE